MILIHTLLVLLLAVFAPAASENTIDVLVNINSDNGEDIAACDPSLPAESRACNLRSAIYYCHDYTPAVACVISFIPDMIISMNAPSVDFKMRGGYGGSNLTIQGQGTVINSAYGNDDRFLEVGDAASMTFVMKHVQLSGFSYMKGSAGCLLVSDIKSLLLENVTFLNNSAMRAGALVSYIIEKAVFKDCRFANNSAMHDGGAVVVVNDFYGNVEVDGCEFTGNNAGLPKGRDIAFDSSGAAIYIADHSSDIYIYNSTFTDNVHTLRGGAVGLGAAVEDVTIRNCQFFNNGAGYHGGALYAETGSLNLLIQRTLFEKNYAFDGGATHISGAEFPVTVESDFIENFAEFDGGAQYFDETEGLVSADNRYIGNSGGRGGAITVDSDCFITNIVRCHFEDNTAIQYGGAFASVTANVFTTIFNSTFVHNKASLYSGGAVTFIDYHYSINIANCNFTFNEATEGMHIIASYCLLFLYIKMFIEKILFCFLLIY
jgi:predicted outer membrane repeat protein